MAVELSINMPCLDEAEMPARCIVEARAFLERTGSMRTPPAA
jgi:hypothetical protein